MEDSYPLNGDCLNTMLLDHLPSQVFGLLLTREIIDRQITTFGSKFLRYKSSDSPGITR